MDDDEEGLQGFRDPAHQERGKFIVHAIWVEMALSNVLAEALGWMEWFRCMGGSFDPCDEEILQRHSARMSVLGRILHELSFSAKGRILRYVLRDIPSLGDHRELCNKVDRVIADRNILAHAPGPTADWVSGEVGDALYELPARTEWEFYNLGKGSKVLNMEEAFERAQEASDELTDLASRVSDYFQYRPGG